MENTRPIPVGVQSFGAIRNQNYVYVDKTAFIQKLDLEGMAYFLTRPRRFGKSMFLSTLEAYFLGKKELFKGLAIEKIKAERGEEWQSYPVLKLDLNAQEYTKREHLESILNFHVDRWKDDYDVQFSATDPCDAFARIINSLYDKFNKKVVVLIDEYDKPLIATLENLSLNDTYRSMLKAFYGVIKSSNDYLHLSFLTGITQFSKVSIFSDLNNLCDISMNHNYSAICGVTQEELEATFSDAIKELANVRKVSYQDALKMLKKKYDGYHFDESLVDVYNPFSLCYALNECKLGNYWFKSGGTPSFIVHMFESHSFSIPDLQEGIELKLGDMDIYKPNYDNFVPLLFQSGYLTIKAYDSDFDTYILRFPNEEVKYAMLEHLMNIYTSACDETRGVFAIKNFWEKMRAGDIDGVLTLIKALLASIPYDSLPEDKLFLREQNYQTAIYLIFLLMGQYAMCEVHSSSGRSDVEVETKDAIYIFEFKVGGKPLEAIEQIKKAGYAEKHSASSKNVFLIGASISRNKRTLTKWQIEKMK